MVVPATQEGYLEPKSSMQLQGTEEEGTLALFVKCPVIKM